jgi:hypothetical protein
LRVNHSEFSECSFGEVSIGALFAGSLFFFFLVIEMGFMVGMRMLFVYFFCLFCFLWAVDKHMVDV